MFNIVLPKRFRLINLVRVPHMFMSVFPGRGYSRRYADFSQMQSDLSYGCPNNKGCCYLLLLKVIE